MATDLSIGKLILSTSRTFLIGVVILGLLLFLPAWTFAYWRAWVFIFVFLTCVNAIGLYLSLKNPELLERRKKVGPAAEQSPLQKLIMAVAFLGLLTLIIFCALDYRFGWSPAPAWASLAGDGLVALGLYMNFLVFRANSFGGSTVEIFEGQQLITTGPYALIRHPMYAGVLVMMVGVPVALGSWFGLVVLALILPFLIVRILDEEKLLKRDLPGYAEYMQKVRYRLVPYIW